MSPIVAVGSNPNSRPSGSTNINIVQHSTPPLHVPLNINNNNNSNHNNNSSGWSASCLRPSPPLRPCLALSIAPNSYSPCSGRKPTSFKEDAFILDVIEAYCFAVKPRNAVNSGMLITLIMYIYCT